MLLPNCKIPSWSNLKLKESGLDSLKRCLDKQHFKNYPKAVSYEYNSRGFRDVEWPSTDLKNVIWCFGDSFTVGIGQPFDEIWVRKLNFYKRSVNISMAGASVNWITRKVVDVLSQIAPRFIIIQWTFLHRREHANHNLSDVERRIRDSNTTIEQDIENYVSCLNQIKQATPNGSTVIHSWIPVSDDYSMEYTRALKCILDQKQVKLRSYVLDNTQLDYARDNYHYDLQTSKKYVQYYLDEMRKFNK